MNKLLVVDDDLDILTICRYSFESLEGVEVRYAHSGEQAIKEALDFEPDLILLDVMMPVMDGIATLRAIHLLPTLSATPIIFLTAKLQETEIAEYLRLGAIGVLKKPFDPLTIGSEVLELFNSWRASR